MLISKLLLIMSTVVLLVSMLLSVGYNRSSDDVDVEVIPIGGDAIGPESFDFNPIDGTGPYTGVSDGRIIKLEASERGWIDFAVTSPERSAYSSFKYIHVVFFVKFRTLGIGLTQSHDNSLVSPDPKELSSGETKPFWTSDGGYGPDKEHINGRPLGLKFDKRTGDLYIADAYFGLLAVGSNGGLATNLVSKAQGLPLLFTNSLDLDTTDRLIYFTDSSQRYTRRDHLLVVLTNDKTGSLIKYDIGSKEAVVLLKNLTFPNGVALSQDGNFLLVAETTNCRILRYWLKTVKAGTLEVFADLPGFPDNIKRNQNGEFWVAMYSRRPKILRWIHSCPWVVNALMKLPIDIVKLSSYIAKAGGEGLAAKLGVDGEILEILEDVNGKIWKYASEVMERDGYLWIGSVETPFAVKLKIKD
ncbi:hypothetical protein OSB04_023648 [Centaurea solstitialis]|uniref:Strictosidine synthase conserved region domain-containing protein n=1 Tax=Centaurea solstitialis TaxID=347529 RepID=A0AA38SWE4_9ASTR|nr:hypothetical protein OSB04_023648 [Centaurea solstitialis]